METRSGVLERLEVIAAEAEALRAELPSPAAEDLLARQLLAEAFTDGETSSSRP